MESDAKSEPTGGIERKSLVLRAAVVVVLAGLTVAICNYGTPVPVKPETGIILEFPAQVAGFIDHNQATIGSRKVAFPGNIEVAKQAYTDPIGHYLECQFVTAGNGKASILRPEDCLAPLGWRIKGGSVFPVNLADGKTLDVMRLFASRRNPVPELQKPGLEWVFMYWFIGSNSTTPHYLQTQKINLDLLLGKAKPAWACIIVGAPVMSDQSANELAVEKTEKMLSTFIGSLYPAIKKKG